MKGPCRPSCMLPSWQNTVGPLTGLHTSRQPLLSRICSTSVRLLLSMLSLPSLRRKLHTLENTCLSVVVQQSSLAASASVHARLFLYLLRGVIQHTSSQKRREISAKSGFRSGYL